MKIGVFGGTFDPPHIGHLVVAQDACARLGLDRVRFVPAAVPPHKRDRSVSPAEIRLDMIRAAIADDPRFEVDDAELKREGPSFTVDTLRAFHEHDPRAVLFFLMGVDQLRELHTWREPKQIAAMATLVVVSRRGTHDVAPKVDVPYRSLEVTRIDVSSTEIRRRVRDDEPIRYLVPEPVRTIVRRERLYTGAPDR